MKKQLFTVDLQKIKDPKGSFPCPNCGQILDPADETFNNYRITDSHLSNGNLSGLTLICKKCNSTIKLTNFRTVIKKQDKLNRR